MTRYSMILKIKKKHLIKLITSTLNSSFCVYPILIVHQRGKCTAFLKKWFVFFPSIFTFFVLGSRNFSPFKTFIPNCQHLSFDEILSFCRVWMSIICYSTNKYQCKKGINVKRKSFSTNKM